MPIYYVTMSVYYATMSKRSTMSPKIVMQSIGELVVFQSPFRSNQQLGWTLTHKAFQY